MTKEIIPGKKQIIYSRYEYDQDKSTEEVFREVREMFKPQYDERGVQVGGVSAAISVTARRVILLVYSQEADAFLQLKFCNREDVQINRYIESCNEN